MVTGPFHVCDFLLIVLQKGGKYKVALSKDSRKFYERYRSHSLVGEDINLPRLRALAAQGTEGSEGGNNLLTVANQQQQIMEESK